MVIVMEKRKMSSTLYRVVDSPRKCWKSGVSRFGNVSKYGDEQTQDTGNGADSVSGAKQILYGVEEMNFGSFEGKILKRCK